MPVMLSKTYDALIAAGRRKGSSCRRGSPRVRLVTDRQERSPGVAQYENRFAKIETDLAVLKADMTALKWMVGVNLAATVSILVKILV
jgi:hypothetical protein